MLDGHVHFGSFPAATAEILIGIFSAGHLMRVGQKKTKERPDVEKLEGVDEVWAICFRKPKPGWRLLGRWFDDPEGQYVFVALRPWDKVHLFSKYPQACQEVIDDWSELFGVSQPKRTQNLGDYLGGVVTDVD